MIRARAAITMIAHSVTQIANGTRRFRCMFGQIKRREVFCTTRRQRRAHPDRAGRGCSYPRKERQHPWKAPGSHPRVTRHGPLHVTGALRVTARYASRRGVHGRAVHHVDHSERNGWRGTRSKISRDCNLVNANLTVNRVVHRSANAPRAPPQGNKWRCNISPQRRSEQRETRRTAAMKKRIFTPPRPATSSQVLAARQRAARPGELGQPRRNEDDTARRKWTRPQCRLCPVGRSSHTERYRSGPSCVAPASHRHRNGRPALASLRQARRARNHNLLGVGAYVVPAITPRLGVPSSFRLRTVFEGALALLIKIAVAAAPWAASQCFAPYGR
jgi:hypothetical protein